MSIEELKWHQRYRRCCRRLAPKDDGEGKAEVKGNMKILCTEDVLVKSAIVFMLALVNFTVPVAVFATAVRQGVLDRAAVSRRAQPGSAQRIVRAALRGPPERAPAPGA